MIEPNVASFERYIENYNDECNNFKTYLLRKKIIYELFLLFEYFEM